MTDHAKDLDQAERIRRLQARRAASTRTTHASAELAPGADDAAGAAPAPVRAAAARARRGHPAAATRWLLAGLSAASFFTIAGTIAVANVNAVGSAQPATPVVAAPAAPAAPAAGAVAVTPQAATPAPAAPAATTKAAPVAPVAHTTTRGS
jgi:hypothetical protein